MLASDPERRVAPALAQLSPWSRRWDVAKVCVWCFVDQDAPHEPDCPWAMTRVDLGLPVSVLPSAP